MREKLEDDRQSHTKINMRDLLYQSYLEGTPADERHSLTEVQDHCGRMG